MQVIAADGTDVDVRARAFTMPLLGPGPATGGSVPLVSSVGGVGRSASYRSIYLSNPWVWGCVQLYARGVAGLPLKVYKLLEGGGRERVRGDTPGAEQAAGGASLDNLLRNPQPGVPRGRVLRRTMANKLVQGNALLRIERDQASRPKALHVIPWSRVKPITGSEIDLLGFEVRPANGTWGGTTFHPPEDVIHLVDGDDTDGPIGISRLAPLSATMALHDAITRHVLAYYRNQARPSGLLKTPQMPSEEDYNRLRKQLDELYTSPENAGRVLITSAEWQTLAEETGTSTLIDLVRSSREEVCAAYGVPPPLVGILDKAIKANVRELREQYVRDVLGAEVAAVEAEVNAQLVPQQPAWRYHFVEFDLAERLRPDLEARAQAFKALESTYTPNERRRMENLPDIDHPDANTVWLPPGSLPLGAEPPPAGEIPTAPPVDPEPVDTNPDDDVDDEE